MRIADFRSANLRGILIAVALLSSACGYIGGPLPPLANVPARVFGLAAVQRGNRIIVQFTLPLRTTENVTIKDPLHLDLRVGLGVNPFNLDRWAERAKQIPAPKVVGGNALYEIPAAEWTGKEVTIGVRTTGANGKPSEWSNLVQVEVVPPPAKPVDVQAETTPAGVHLTWHAAGEHFRVLRKAATEQSYSMVAPDLHTPEFLDATAAVGTDYGYLVQTYVPQGPNKEAQGDLSDELKFTRQAPPPATPAGLLAVPASDTIELNWESNAGPETTGYRIYRAVGNGEFTKIGEVSAVPTYSDHAVEHGKTYRYIVTAIDKDGRESGRPAPVEVTLP